MHQATPSGSGYFGCIRNFNYLIISYSTLAAYLTTYRLGFIDLIQPLDMREEHLHTTGYTILMLYEMVLREQWQINSSCL